MADKTLYKITDTSDYDMPHCELVYVGKNKVVTHTSFRGREEFIVGDDTVKVRWNYFGGKDQWKEVELDWEVAFIIGASMIAQQKVLDNPFLDKFILVPKEETP